MYLAQGFCLFALIVFVEGALPRYKTNAPPRNARIKWNEVDDGSVRRISGCRGNARDNTYCDFHFYKSKFRFFDDQGRILIGARNQLHVLDLSLNSQKKILWRSGEVNYNTCWSVQSESQKETDCENYIKFVEPYPNNEGRMVLCGTYSLYRACLVVNSSLLLNGSADVRLHEHFPSPSILTREEAFFAGRASDDNLLGFIKNRDKMVLFSAAPSIQTNSDYRVSFIQTGISGENSTQLSLSTQQYVNNKESQFLQSPVEFRQYFQANYFNATKLNDGPVDRGTKDFTFLLFNEVAYEDNGGEKARYARLGRLCSNDKGVSHFDRTYFQTFVKARLLCQVESPGGPLRHQGRVFNYDRIMGGHLQHGTSVGSEIEWITDRVFYGAFSGHGLGPKGSAICVYNATRSPSGVKQDNHGFIDIFSGDYYRQGSPTPDANKDPFSCTDDPRPKDEALTHTLIHRPALPIYDAPMVILDGYVITNIVVDTTPIVTGFNSETKKFTLGIQDVIFVAVDDGSIIKVYTDSSAPSTHKGRAPEAIFPEVIELSDQQPISDMVIKESEGKKSLYVLSYSNVYRLPLHRCGRYKTCSECIGARDPYCFWDVKNRLCGPLADNVTGSTDRFLQNLTSGSSSSCPSPMPDRPNGTIQPSSTYSTSSSMGTSTEGLLFSSTQLHTTPTPDKGSLQPEACSDKSGSLLFFVIGTLFLIIGCSLALVALVIICQNLHRRRAKHRDVESTAVNGIISYSKSREMADMRTVSKSSTLTSEDVRNCISVSAYQENDNVLVDNVFTDNKTVCNGTAATNIDNSCMNVNNNSVFPEIRPRSNSNPPRVNPVIIVPSSPSSEEEETNANSEDNDAVPELKVVVPRIVVPSEPSLLNGLKPCVSTEFDHLEEIRHPTLINGHVASSDDQYTVSSASDEIPRSVSPLASQGSLVIGDYDMRCDSAA